jgi:peptidoglycan/xylan/chitin deacetylase (PgdA/CDA1 family)
MFHRVQPCTSIVYAQHLGLPSVVISLENFQELLDFVHRHFSCVPVSKFAHPERNGDGSTYCALTFDDGYRDFQQHAWPEIQRRGLPVTVFVPTAMIGTEERFWWDELYHACMTSAVVAPNAVLAPVSALLQQIVKSPAARRSPLVYELVERVQGWSPAQVQALIGALSPQNGGRAAMENRLLTWDEVGNLHRSGVQFGSHTRHHCNLQTVSAAQAQEEIATSRRELEEILQEQVDTFAFPGGHVSDDSLRILAASGYALACSTRKGMNRRGEDVFRMRRVNIWDGVVQDFRGRFSPAVAALNLMRAVP